MSPAIQQWLQGLSVWDVGFGVVTLAGLVFAVWRVMPLVRKLANFIDDVVGEPERAGVPARPGLMQRVQRIEHELFPNSGLSTRDAINRTEEAVKGIRVKLDEDERRLEHLELTEQHERVAHCAQHTEENA